ncbi:dTDP-glucose 4,6-dehydratase [Streptomyces sp. DT2A-34]|uniref:dTDP-glucose 4,6-dehydratase n=1 Tax=unclassified Streptomyces TaxID=2593676 RepID=UPI00265B7869|nr:dTDP-glucose 4,6-dehydratase [Streptomyces sp. DT2A-34]MDO0917787.1 dTDP-glucose 4,6-dehydratase [Streptomyces sp. DT2A-34]
MDKILVTGGAGFIGSHFVRRLLAAPDITTVTVLDSLTYAGHRENLGEAFLSPKLDFVHGDICDAALVDTLVAHHDTVVHFAAESHVDRSFLAAGRFLATNITGTHTLLAAATRHHVTKFVHVSTDEVYGPMATGRANEDAPLRPTVPYAASKAAADLITLSYHRTFGLPVCITRSSNNYGPRQHPEKIIPLFVTRLLQGESVTVHGHGQHVRNWLHVDDNCHGIELVLRAGEPGCVYNLGGGTDLTGLALTGRILAACDAGADRIEYVPDRPSNDLRYAMDCTRATALGYRPERDFDQGLTETVAWYRNHPERWAPLLHAEQATTEAGACRV